MYDIISTALVVCREGFESLLLTAMIIAALPAEQKPVYYLNFIITWFLTFLLGWQTIDLLTTQVENMENILKIVAGMVMIYVFVNSKEIFSHAKEHVDRLDTSSFLITNVTIFLIVVREAAESLVFLRSAAEQDFANTMMGVVAGAVGMLLLLFISGRYSRKWTNQLVFRYIGTALVLAGLYYVCTGAYELAEIYGVI
jgi:high-affinity Fe2+/Pb2+ permease